MKRTCDICRREYESILKVMGPNSFPIWLSDNVRLTTYDDEHTYIHHFNVCPDCAKRVLTYIKKITREENDT